VLSTGPLDKFLVALVLVDSGLALAQEQQDLVGWLFMYHQFCVDYDRVSINFSVVLGKLHHQMSYSSEFAFNPLDMMKNRLNLLISVVHALESWKRCSDNQ
jgi:hypothetical protein